MGCARFYRADVDAAAGCDEEECAGVSLRGPGTDVADLGRVGIYITQLREPDRARAAPSLYRKLVLLGLSHILLGQYRSERLLNSTLLLFGGSDSALPPALANVLLRGHENHADLLEVAFVERAAHFIVDEQPEWVLALAMNSF